MLVVLNLTMPPILLLYLPVALIGYYALPAPPASEVAAFSLGGSPLPTWVLNGTLYVLQGGEPAVAVYVPSFSNSSGVYSVAVEGPFVAQAPPGVMVVEARPRPARVAVNKTGLYLYFDSGGTIAYYAFEVRPATQATTAVQPQTPAESGRQTVAPPHDAGSASGPSTGEPTTGSAAGKPTTPAARGAAPGATPAGWLAAAALVAVAVAIAIILIKSKRK